VRSVREDARGIVAPDLGLQRFRLDRYPPSPEVARLVDRYWVVTWDLRGRPSHTQHVFPHPVVNVTFQDGGPGLVTGVSTTVVARTLSGAGRVLGIMFRPAGFRPLLGRPMATIRDATDYDDSVPPSVGQVIAWNGKDFAPQDPNVLTPRFFTVPQANFVNFTGISTRHTIGSFLIPPMPFDYVPIVWGHIKSTGVELDADPFIIGCEVRIGNATSGELIGRGFGNISTWTTIVPHVSTNQDITRAISPDNGVGVIPGYSTGEASTLYINLFNDGLAGVYQFNRNNAQLAVMVMPVSPLLEPES